MKNTCIRVLADVNQILQCRGKVRQVDESIDILSNALALAGNTIRLKILYLLQEEGQLCPCDLSDILGMGVSAISQHLRKLKDGKLVVSKKTGQTIFYSLNRDYAELLKPIFKLVSNNSVLDRI